jgi:hypothetical protein
MGSICGTTITVHTGVIKYAMQKNSMSHDKPKHPHHKQADGKPKHPHHKHGQPCPAHNWEEEQASALMCALTAQLGPPDALAPQEGGLAIWHAPAGTGMDSITVKDEAVAHRCPAKHHDFVYSTLHVHLPPARVFDVLRLSGSVGYDGLKQELTARCGSLEANLATLALATDIATNQVTIDEVQSGGLYAHTIGSIMCDATEDKCADTVQELKDRIQANATELAPQPSLDYFELAFDAQCQAPGGS